MMEIVILILMLLFGFLIRLGFSVAEASDEWVSFWHILRQKDEKWVSYAVNDSVIKGTYGYPVLPHFIVSKFPEKHWGFVGKVLNILYDLVTALMVYGFTKWLVWLLRADEVVAGLSLPLVAVLIYLTTPILFSSSSRMKTIKGRSLGGMLSVGYFLLLGMGMFSGAWWWFLGSLGLGLLIVLSSLFALQVMVFFSLFLSVYLWSWWPVMVVLAVLVVSVGLDGGLRGPLMFWWHHKKWYAKNIEKSAIKNRNRLRDILLLPVYLFTNPKKFVYLIAYKITPIIGVMSAPGVFFLIGAWFFSYVIGYNFYFNFLWGLVLASLFCFAVTSISWGKAFGEAERYFEYSAAFYAILMVFVLMNLPAWVFWVLLMFHLTCIFFYFAGFVYQDIVRDKPKVSLDLDEAVKWCLKNVKGVLLTVPCKLSFLVSTLMKREGYKYYYRFISQKGKDFSYFNKDMGGYIDEEVIGRVESMEIFSTLPSELAKNYGAKYFLIEKVRGTGLKETWGEEGQFLDFPVFENKKFMVCEIGRKN